MKRIFSLLAVTALMVAMLVATAMPAFAAKGGKSAAAPNCERGQVTAAFDQETFEGFLKHIDKVVNQCGGIEF